MEIPAIYLFSDNHEFNLSLNLYANYNGNITLKQHNQNTYALPCSVYYYNEIINATFLVSKDSRFRVGITGLEDSFYSGSSLEKALYSFIRKLNESCNMHNLTRTSDEHWKSKLHDNCSLNIDTELSQDDIALINTYKYRNLQIYETCVPNGISTSAYLLHAGNMSHTTAHCDVIHLPNLKCRLLFTNATFAIDTSETIAIFPGDGEHAAIENIVDLSYLLYVNWYIDFSKYPNAIAHHPDTLVFNENHPRKHIAYYLLRHYLEDEYEGVIPNLWEIELLFHYIKASNLTKSANIKND